ncbi:hypothetical protein [Clostridium cylindrosporum]|uniref:Uncharacterized protein n=1 Tax=Clostridium cylindrosporum DSM 605 TaxID=1121307 RepID=A0A0J8D6A2_CLOCY|nr:hypothetical protein [Clostridium cylindrosporum]KMT21382.1 hypothetical protein CLCY_2c01420 [Clostridium cylindrosporum DSM 605]
MIQIDDAGSGSLVGGTVIGIMRVETGDYYYEVIPIKYFKSPYFEDKKYNDYSTKIIKRGLNELLVSKDEPIEICQGYMFNSARKYLQENGYNFTSGKIDQPLQNIIEETFTDYCVGLGIPLDYLDYTKYPFHFHRLIKWVFADFKSREKLCKTAWKSWKKHSSIDITSSYDYIYSGNYYCLKCGNQIKVPSKIKTIKYLTNKEHTIYVHTKCNA